jgi:RNA polymerase sigma factor (sigma-70 family)
MTIRRTGSVLRQIDRVFGEGPVSGMTDAQLLERFFARQDEIAFQALVTRHGPMVFGVCRRLLKDSHDAEDAFQATFLVMVRAARSRQLTASLKSWLYRVAHRIAVRGSMNAARRRQREQRVARTGVSLPQREIEPDIRPMLVEEIARLPEKYRTPVLLCYFEGMTEESAAVHMGCPLGTVSGRLCRARDLLRTRLTRRGVALSTGLFAAAFSFEAVSAEVPASLIESTVKAATQLATENVLVAGMVSASAASLVGQASKAILMDKLKVFAALGIASVLVAFGAVVAIRASGAADRPKQEPGGPIASVATTEPIPGTDGDLGATSTLPTSPLPTFDGITFERILTGGVNEPLFLDIDTGRFLTPPFGLSPADPGKPLFLPNLAFTPQLGKWARDHGIDAVAQTDGRVITFMGYGLQTGELLPSTTQVTSLKPVDVLKQVGLRAPRAAVDSVTFTRVFEPGNFGSCVPFVTREGGIGILDVLGFCEPALRGPNAMTLDYVLVRGVRSPRAGVQSSPQKGVPEPMVLGEFAGFLTFDVRDGKLVFRQPGSLERVEVDRGKIVVLSGNTILLEASRICTGQLDIDARGNRVIVFGRGVEASFSRVGDKVRVEMGGRFAEEKMMRPSLPELRFFSEIEWKDQ